MSVQIEQSLIPCKAAAMDAAVLPDGRWLLYQRELREAITLSAPAGILWELCDGQTPVSDLLQQLQELYPDTPADQLESETARILQQFLEQGLVYPSTT